MVKRAFISGATKGIGNSIAHKLAKEGFNLLITARNEQDLLATKNELESTFSVVVDTFSADYSSSENLKKLSQFIIDKNINFNIIVNNTGIYTLDTCLDNSELLIHALQVNLIAHQSITKTLVPLLYGEQSHIFNIGSIVTKQARKEAAFYTISKQAFATWTNLLFENLRNQNIKVTHVIPSGTYTASWGDTPINKDLLLHANDVADAIWNAYNTSKNTVIEEIVLRKTIEL